MGRVVMVTAVTELELGFTTVFASGYLFRLCTAYFPIGRAIHHPVLLD